MKETPAEREKLLEVLPTSCDTKDLAAILLQFSDQIKAYCQVYDILPALQRFKAEEAVPFSELCDKSRYLTIRFSQESVVGESSPTLGERSVINPRQVVQALALAIRELDESWGIDPGMDSSNWPAIAFSRIAYLTLDWVDGQTLTPAFRYRLGQDPITSDDVRRIIAVIQEGRKKLAPPPQLAGGVIEA